MIKLNKCQCGKAPQYHTTTKTFGHGDCPRVWWADCDCGMRTREFPEGYEGTTENCQQKAANIWNKHNV